MSEDHLSLSPPVDAPLVTTVRPLTDNIQLTPTGIAIKGMPSLEEWGTALNETTRLANVSLWAIGDLIVYGESREWGEMYTQYIELTQRSYFTLANAVRVSREFPPGKWRVFVALLSWSHHRETLVLPEIADRMAVLADAAQLKWSRDDLRDHIRGILGHPTLLAPGEPAPEAVRTTYTCPACKHEWMP
jgi:hypothetical protein